MGKPKSVKKRAELAAAKRANNELEVKAKKDEETASIISTSRTAPWDLRSDVFRDVEIGSTIVKERISGFDDADVRTVISSKTFKGLNVKKKDKRKIKRELWSQKVGIMKAAKDTAKNKKKREKTVITGDLLPLMESLPDVEKYLESRKVKEAKPRSTQKEKTRLKQQLADMDIFKQVLKHPAYQKNPVGTIKEHVTNKIKQEEEMDSL